MNSMEKINRFNDSKKEYLIRTDSIEMRAAKFVSDPALYVENIRMRLLDEGADEKHIAKIAIDELQFIRDYFNEHLVAEDHNLDHRVKRFVTGKRYSFDAERALFELLQMGQFTKEEVLTWLDYELFGLVDYPNSEDNGLKSLIHEVYGETK